MIHEYPALAAKNIPTIRKNNTPFQLSKLNTKPIRLNIRLNTKPITLNTALIPPKRMVNAMLTAGVNKHTAAISM
jgi:hypothetical protein